MKTAKLRYICRLRLILNNGGVNKMRKCNVYDVKIICDDIVQYHKTIKSLWDIETLSFCLWMSFGGDIDVKCEITQLSGKQYPKMIFA